MRYKKIDNYDLKVFDTPEDLFSIINEKECDNSLSKVVTGPGWGLNEDIILNGKKYYWASDVE